ncbi:GNAT family N-acetyltransferase [Agarivorans sp. MS3-6]|uniref:GNAT family N-acetyltransferase n=1 Tax=Agarivorans sp. TSD2052 TaxID=2937286 RepID=UPI00200D1799|nr:GNAT family protein [Agarivorans sp. TSD2052]UPW17631.1 GNAT family N-acetyltransferase [Agarivorans sp. TSD2052]
MRGQQVLIRPYLPEDAAAHAQAVRETAENGQRWLEWMEEDYPEDESRSWLALSQAAIAKNIAFDMGIFANQGGAFLGAIAINRIEWNYRSANLGYWVRESASGAGIATEAVSLMADYAFNALQLNRLEMVIAEHNFASRRVADKANAQFEGLARARVVEYGKPVHAAIYSLIPSDL